MLFNPFWFFPAATFFILCTAAYINHRLFKNSDNFLKRLMVIALFTTMAESSIIKMLDILKDGMNVWFLVHFIIWGLWILGMFADNFIEKKWSSKLE